MVTTPLQLLFALSLLDNVPQGTKTDFIFVGNFAGAKAISNRLPALLPGELSSCYCPTFQAASAYISALRPDRLYLDADVGVCKGVQLLQLRMRMPRLRIAVYEEGCGSYRDDLYVSWKKHLLPIFGFGIHFGGSPLTSEIHLLRPEVYRLRFPNSRVEVMQIRRSPSEVIKADMALVSKIFDYIPIWKSGESCTLYLSSWTADKSFMQMLSAEEGDVFFKPHPHFKDEIGETSLIRLPAHAPAELVLTDLIGKYQRVRVFHHGSSVAGYFDERGIEFIQI